MGVEASGPKRADSTMVFRGRFEKWLTVQWFWEAICEIESPGQGFLVTHAQKDVYMTTHTGTRTRTHKHVVLLVLVTFPGLRQQPRALEKC